jgi:hypothetical protein
MLLNDIFHVDWIFVDTLIIILLVLLLIGVKIFKSTYRWRLGLSNEALEYHSFHNIEDQVKSQNLSTKHWDLTKNTILINKNLSDKVILIIRTTHKKKLLRILTEGLCSYGFTVITLKIKSKSKSISKINTGNIIDELQSLISSIIDNSKQKELITRSNYILLQYSNSLVPTKSILTDPNNKGLILINPNMNKNSIGIHQELFNSQQQLLQLFYIFSKRSFFILKNKHLKLYKKNFGDIRDNKIKLVTLEKSGKRFKYYETILLGIIIDIIETKLIESKIHE